MVHPVPPAVTSISLDDVTVVLPVKDDAVGLADTLTRLPEGVAVVVVDDGSEPVVDRASVEAAGGTLIRRPEAGGPGVARQDALASVTTPLVAFIDAGVRLGPTSLDRLISWFEDSTVVAVGPRVSSTPGPGLLPHYEEQRSPLDLGPTPAKVGPTSPVTYLPTACLVARRAAIETVGGFDPALRWGEDVDLVWRLADEGTIRFDPSVVVEHPPRASLRDFVKQRIGYGSAAGPLAKRHPDRLAPVRLSGWSLACWAIAASGRPRAGALLAAGTVVALHRKLAGTVDDSEVEAVLLGTRGHLFAGRALARAATRVWWPLLALAWVLGARGVVHRAVALSILDRWLGASGTPVDRLADLGIGVVDDAAYGIGVWRGAVANRSLRPFLPDLAEWPPRNEG